MPLNEDWGKGNYAKAYVAMKNFQILPLDTTLANTEGNIMNTSFQKLDMEQTNRLISRINLANYFKAQAFEVIGITPQRMGSEVEKVTAEGVRTAVANSYAQTETYFINHCDHLMPRVHQMRTDLAQYYQSRNPSLRLSYITTAEDRANFKINGTKLLLRDINVFCTTKANTRAIMEQLKQLAFNSTSGQTSIYELGKLIKSESISEIDSILKQSERKKEEERKQEMQHEQEMLDKEIQDQVNERREKMAFEASENEKDRQKDILEAEIRSAGYGSMVDKDENMQNDYLDALKVIQQGENYQQVVSLDRSKQQQQSDFHRDKMQIAREKLLVDREKNATALQVARENITASELQAKRKLKADRAKSKAKKKK